MSGSWFQRKNERERAGKKYVEIDHDEEEDGDEEDEVDEDGDEEDEEDEEDEDGNEEDEEDEDERWRADEKTRQKEKGRERLPCVSTTLNPQHQDKRIACMMSSGRR